MSLVREAIARYHKLIESPPYIDLEWAHALDERIKQEKLGGRPVSPVLRPHLITQRDYATLEKSAELLLSAMTRMGQMVLATPALMARIQLLPAERMLAAVEPGYPGLSVTSLLDAQIDDGVLRYLGHAADVPAGVLYGDALADAYFEAPLVKEFRKKYKLKKVGGLRNLLNGILKAYKGSGAKNKKPTIAIVEFRQPSQPITSSEYWGLAEFFNREGYSCEIISPEQLEYRSGVLRRGDFIIDIVYRRVGLQEFLVRLDLNHALMRAYKERSVCMVNSFRAEMSSKRAMFDLLTDETLTAKFPAAEKKIIKDSLPWTRMISASKTMHKNKTVDLPEFMMKQKDKLVIRANDDHGQVPPLYGATVDDATWERAIRAAMRTPSVVQEAGTPVHAVFPLMQFGNLVMKDMLVHTHPHAFLGKVTGASTWLSAAGSNGFSTLTGLAPTFVLEGK